MARGALTAAELVDYPGDGYVLGGKEGSGCRPRVDYSPYEGRIVRGGPVIVMSRCEVIVDHAEWKGRAGRGQFLKRSHGAARPA